MIEISFRETLDLHNTFVKEGSGVADILHSFVIVLLEKNLQSKLPQPDYSPSAIITHRRILLDTKQQTKRLLHAQPKYITK